MTVVPQSRRARIVAAGIAITSISLAAIVACEIGVYRTPTDSMAPTLLPGDAVLAWKHQLMGPIARGTIVVFTYPHDEHRTFMKRVIGIAGDEIAFEDDRPEISGRDVRQDPLGTTVIVSDDCQAHTLSTLTETIGTRSWTIARDRKPGVLADAYRITVPPGQVFVAGDNRDHSQDSRAWGLVPVANLVGTIDRVWFSADACTRRIRWDRIGPVH